MLSKEGHTLYIGWAYTN